MCWKRCAAATVPWSARLAGPAAIPAISIRCMSASSTRAAISTPAKSIPESGCKNGCRWSNARRLARRQNHGAAFAEADPRTAVFGAKAAEDDLVAVFDEAALLATRQLDRFAAARGEFQKAAPARFLRTRDRAGSDQIADLEVAAVAGVMRDH